ncbi:flagellin [Marinibactrum halimedae]|uniref:Flagellin n=1 Tax=Marinibactrum halimedae TaxID=1444977 RepID=A0AA37TBX0_9GAMM|nr:flagellin [Marinibactrum halimedae]GLS27356.1 B-type flagellin [Marinibactrum halimedae]
MALTVNTNVASLNTQRNLNNSSERLDVSLQRLSTGFRINSAKDDAAGLQISNRLTSQVNGLTVAARNASDGISLAQVAEGALQQSTDILQRIRDLALQSANGSNSATERQALQEEVNQLKEELTRIADTTTFGGRKILDGTFGTSSFQVGSEANQTIEVTLTNASSERLGNYRIREAGAAAGGIAGTITEGALGTTTFTDGADVTVTGPFGVGQFTLADTDSAGDVADSINSLTGTTGVTATATNVIRVAAGDLALQGSGPTADSVSLTIGTNRGNGIDQSTTDIVLTATGDAAQDLQNLRDAINADSGGNGLSAIIDENGNLDITAKDGDNIQVTNYVEVDGNTTANDSTITFTAVNTNDATPTVQLVNGGPNTSLEAIGTLTFDSSAPFSLSSTATGLDEISAQSIGVLQSIDDIDVTNVAGAQDAIAVIDGAIANIDSQRAQLGAVQNRFQNTIANLQSIIENVSAARSRIKDTDFAAETAELTRNQILQQAGTTILAQANQLPQAVLGLLGG